MALLGLNFFFLTFSIVTLLLTMMGKKNTFLLSTEQFSIECRKNKTKVNSLANHDRRRQSNEPIRIRSKYYTRRQARENACNQVTIGFRFYVYF